MKELVKISENEKGTQVVSARELHSILEVTTDFTTWCKRMFEYGFENEVDYSLIKIGERSAHNKIDYALTLDCAKEISMLQRSEKGKEVRKYFIAKEKELRELKENPYKLPKTFSEALYMLAESVDQKAELEKTIEAQKPKVLFADAVSASKTSILVGELAKILKQNGIEMGQNRLFQWLRNNGYLISRKGTDYNMPTQRSMELNLFEIKETSITHSDGHISISKTTKINGKGQNYFINKFLNKNLKIA